MDEPWADLTRASPSRPVWPATPAAAPSKPARSSPASGWSLAQWQDWAALQDEHRRDWDEVDAWRRRADRWANDDLAKLVDITIGTLRVAQDGEVRAWLQTGALEGWGESELSEDERRALIAGMLEAFAELAKHQEKKRAVTSRQPDAAREETLKRPL
jgi:hypothetical protein